MKKFIVSCTVVILLLFVSACGKSIETQVAEQLELGQQYLLEQEYEQAVVAFNKAIELEPDTKEAYYGLGQSYEGLAEKAGNEEKEEWNSYYAQAEEAYLRVLQIDTMDRDACMRLIAIYENMGALKKLAGLGTYYYGETADEGLLRQIAESGTCLDVIRKLASLCEERDMDAVFALLQSEDYQKLKDRSAHMCNPVFLIKDGVGIGFYMVNTAGYGANPFVDCMVYYGVFENGLRQGHGLWLGYDSGNNYYALGEWSNDQPNGEQEVILDKKVIRGTVLNGLWNGLVQWTIEWEDGTVRTYPVSFTNGKWDILEVRNGEGGSSEYVVSKLTGEEGDSYLTTDLDDIRGIIGFLPDFRNEEEEIPELLPEENDAEDTVLDET